MTKKIIFIFSISFFIFSFNLTAQDEIIIEGKQIKKSQNVQHVGEAVFVPQKSKIILIEGDLTSFSLSIDNFTKYQFYYSNEQYEPPVYSTIIDPGMYKLYPDLPPDKDSVLVKIKLIYINEWLFV